MMYASSASGMEFDSGSIVPCSTVGSSMSMPMLTDSTGITSFQQTAENMASLQQHVMAMQQHQYTGKAAIVKVISLTKHRIRVSSISPGNALNDAPLSPIRTLSPANFCNQCNNCIFQRSFDHISFDERHSSNVFSSSFKIHEPSKCSRDWYFKL